MSRFYRTGQDSSSSSESEQDEDDKGFTGPSAPSFMVSDDDEDTKRVDKKEKQFRKSEAKNEKVKKDKKERKAQKVRVVKETEDDGEWTTVERTVTKPKLFEKDAEINFSNVIEKLYEIMAERGKKKSSDRIQVELLSELQNISKEHNLGVGIEVKIQFAIIASIFDGNLQISSAMKPQNWEKCMDAIEKLLQLVEGNKETLTTVENINEESEFLEHPPYKVRGCLLSCVEKLDEELTKNLKDSDQHSNEYIDRLKDEPRIVAIIEKAQSIIDGPSFSQSEMCRIYIKRIDHIYFKFDTKVILQKNGSIPKDDITSLQMMDKFCKFIYASDYSRLRTQAILCHIYFHAIHDNWFEARDLMLMSHLQESISHSDTPTQILYNRTMVQLGLCAFRHGEIDDAHNALLDYVASRKPKELLGQGLGMQRYNEQRTDEEEKIAKQRQLPFHMHINCELMECVYLVTAMLIEIPYMAAHEMDGKHRMISKFFFQQLRASERQVLIGPPESMREHVMAGSKVMRIGDWKKCYEFLVNDKMNMKVWDLFSESQKVKKMLKLKIQEETLRTYIFAYSKVYDSISVAMLSEMFDLDKDTVRAVVSKMIMNEEIMAKLDEPTDCMVMDKTEPSRVHGMALQLAQKLTLLCDNNQRLSEQNPGMGQQSNRGRGAGRGNRGTNRNYQNYRN